MTTKKNKTFYHISVDEALRHLKEVDDDQEIKLYVSSLIKASTQAAENYKGYNFATTEAETTIYNFYDCSLLIREVPLIEIDSIEYEYNDIQYTATTENYYIEKYENYFVVNFGSYRSPQFIEADKLTIKYQTGYQEGELPELARQAILIKISSLYDFRSDYTYNNITNNRAFEMLLNLIRNN